MSGLKLEALFLKKFTKPILCCICQCVFLFICRIERIKYIKLDEDSDERKSDHGRDWQMVLSNGFDKGSPVL